MLFVVDRRQPHSARSERSSSAISLDPSEGTRRRNGECRRAVAPRPNGDASGAIAARRARDSAPRKDCPPAPFPRGRSGSLKRRTHPSSPRRARGPGARRRPPRAAACDPRRRDAAPRARARRDGAAGRRGRGRRRRRVRLQHDRVALHPARRGSGSGLGVWGSILSSGSVSVSVSGSVSVVVPCAPTYMIISARFRSSRRAVSFSWFGVSFATLCVWRRLDAAQRQTNTNSTTAVARRDERAPSARGEQ